MRDASSERLGPSGMKLRPSPCPPRGAHRAQPRADVPVGDRRRGHGRGYQIGLLLGGPSRRRVGAARGRRARARARSRETLARARARTVPRMEARRARARARVGLVNLPVLLLVACCLPETSAPRARGSCGAVLREARARARARARPRARGRGRPRDEEARGSIPAMPPPPPLLRPARPAPPPRRTRCAARSATVRRARPHARPQPPHGAAARRVLLRVCRRRRRRRETRERRGASATRPRLSRAAFCPPPPRSPPPAGRRRDGRAQPFFLGRGQVRSGPRGQACVRARARALGRDRARAPAPGTKSSEPPRVSSPVAAAPGRRPTSPPPHPPPEAYGHHHGRARRRQLARDAAALPAPRLRARPRAALPLGGRVCGRPPRRARGPRGRGFFATIGWGVYPSMTGRSRPRRNRAPGPPAVAVLYALTTLGR